MRRRLTLTTVVAVGVALLVVTAGFYLLLSSALERDADATLRARGEAAASTVEVRDGAVVVAESPGDATLDATTWVLGPGGAVVLAPDSTDVAGRDVAALAGVTSATFVDVEPGTRLLATPLARDATGAGSDATIVVSLALAPYERSERIALWSAIALDLAILVVLAAVTRWLVGAALRPVDQMTRQAQDWVAHDVDQRFAIASPTSDEVGRLGSTLNDLLGRLGSSLRHERRLTDEIAHELRTPLARARAEAEVSASSPDPAVLRSALAAIVTDIDELGATIDTLLRSTRGPTPAGARCLLGDAVRAAVALVEPTVPIRVEHEAPEDQEVSCEEALLRRILVPQLENAVRHASTEVRVRSRRAGDLVLIEVLDDGPGIDPDEVERVFDPGVRGRAAHGSGGSGLGLALARRLARSCGADVTAQPGPGGRFTTALPVH